MKKNNDRFVGFIILAFFALIFIGSCNNKSDQQKEISNYTENIFKVISSSENEILDEDIKAFAKDKGYNFEIEYADTLDIVNKLNHGEMYDAVWVSNSIWLYKLDSSVVSVKNSKSTSINPVIFAVKKSKAESLGLTKKDIKTKDILDRIKSGELKFNMSNPTSTNSGASAYLGILSSIAGNPEVLTEDILNNENIKSELKSFFMGQERKSGDEDFLEEMFVKGYYDAVVSYESSIININKKLVKQGKEPLYAIYPIDGVSISDSPIAYIDNKSDSKKAIFDELQSYLLSDKGQKILAKYGRRTWYGGTNKNVDQKIFNPEWGIDTTKYISPIKYPSTDVITKAIGMYQREFRKPMHVVFCLDYSGSMMSSGIGDLRSAMDYVLSEKAQTDMIEFTNLDKIDVFAFNSEVHGPWSTDDGSKTDEILEKINYYSPSGSTALYKAAIKGLNLLKEEDQTKYSNTIILMTDGQGNIGTYNDLESVYNEINKDIPIYSITFGNASESELERIAELTNAKVFDGKSNLVEAFKEVREYS